MPLGITVILITWMVMRPRRFTAAVVLLILLLASQPHVSASLMRWVEGSAEHMPASQAPEADAIVVLSAGRTVAPGAARISEWGDGDRFFAGIDLMAAGRAPYLIFTGGWIPTQPDATLEGVILADAARRMGIPDQKIRVTGRVSSTIEEAAAVMAMLGTPHGPRPRVLLVTSAFHMARARQVFERAGATVLPYPVDFRSGTAAGALSWLPSPSALAETEIVLHEVYGRSVEWLRGQR